MVYGAANERAHFLNEGDIESKYDNVFLHYVNRELDYLKKEEYDESMFNLSLPIYLEAQSCNTGLNKKVCIDPGGNIQNYFTHKQVFGNLAHDAIKAVVMRDDFQEKWKISNDQIIKCKTCQYRYICVSNSDIVSENGQYKKVEDCHFDPLANAWS